MLPAIAALTIVLAIVGPGPAAADPVLVPAGPFWMGRDDGPAAEAPLHRVDVSSLRIDRHKVTNGELARFLDADGLQSPGGERRYDHDDPDARIHRRDGRWRADPGFEDHPAVEVSWFGADDDCRWRGSRLPTEAEWEKAARGVDGFPHPWGPGPPSPERAVFGRSYNATAPTMGRPGGASPWGVEDLLGNLREWTSTILRPYPYRYDDGREGWSGHGAVVVRGASHDDPAAELSVTRRRSYERRGAAAGHHHVGFRCVTSDDPGGRAR